ncbi:universal stress protein [Aeromicrobium terrae]|uniref:Universal stress protein n=1 Tax=Aeromicrobium terrae TaxID=2498846 RepID=A0A5C8NEW0_9ACTN|nr:universal stress protein [Aeromicrobium terrae]TXL57511.1 universal stress protein [Aeromicrobium terrae]
MTIDHAENRSTTTHRTPARRRTIAVAQLGGSGTGALAYALGEALRDPARVIVYATSDAMTTSAPLQTVHLDGDPAAALTDVSAGVDLLVVQVPEETAAATDPVLATLRRESRCLLVEVDEDGELVRASGPEGWSYAAREPVSTGAGSGEVVVGVDGSDSSAAAVRWAAQYAHRTGHQLRLVCAFERDADDASRHHAQDLIRAARRIAGDDVAGTTIPGEPAQVLVDLSTRADVLVLGRHGTSGLIHSALGSVGDTCARMAACPVVVVPAG